MQTLSPLRERLASFEHAYALAIRLRQATGRSYYVVRTGSSLQPIQVSPSPPGGGEQVLAWVP